MVLAYGHSVIQKILMFFNLSTIALILITSLVAHGPFDHIYENGWKILNNWSFVYSYLFNGISVILTKQSL